MENKILRTCIIANDLYASECSIRQISSTNYDIDVTEDPLSVFEGFELQSRRFDNMKVQQVICMFKEMCLDAYTCHGSFSIEEVRLNGEKIEFSSE